MKRFSKLLVSVFSLPFVATMFAAGGGAKETGKNVHVSETVDIGIVLPTKDEPRWAQDDIRFKNALKDTDYSVEIKFSQGCSVKEKENVDALIANGIKILIICPQDEAKAAAVVEAAKGKGISVISYDKLITNTGAVDYYVTFDYIAVGKAQGQYLINHAKGTGKPLYLYAGASSDNNAFLLFEGAWSVLQPKIADGTFVIANSSEAENLKNKATLTRGEMGKIIGQVTTNWDFNKTKTMAKSHLAAVSSSIKNDVAILAPNDETARAIIDVFATNKGIKSYVVTGQNAERASEQYILDGKQSMTVLKDERTLVRDSIDIAKALLKESTPATTVTYNNGKIDVKAKQSSIIVVDKSNITGILMDQHLKEAYERGFFNGNVLLAKGNHVIYENALGFADLSKNKALNTESVFEIASVSKQFTATSILMLRDRGLLSLSDNMEKYFPDTPYKGITIKNLLNHTSGLPDYMEWVEKKGRESNTIPMNAVMSEFLVKSGIPALFAPNEDWSYCNTAYALLALIVEKASGESYADFLKKEIFEPAGMNDSCVYHRRLNGDTIKNYAYGYVLEDGQYVLPDESTLIENNCVIPLDGIEGDGCVNSTIHDMLKWSLALKEGKILSHKSQEEMYTPTRYDHSKIAPYGYGWAITQDTKMGKIAAHSGGWIGCSTKFVRYLDKDITLICLKNADPTEYWGDLTTIEGFMDIAKGQLPRPIRTFEELIDSNADSSGYAALCGKYERDTEVFQQGDKLYVTSPEYGEKVELLPSKEGGFITEDGNSLSIDDQKITLDKDTLEPEILRRLE
ncbi:serine hydrolase [Tissierella praeacuta]|uniref:serine hydrolase n=1 Tax=Tissierella praeacuta TaxID=43131 RepID=UPI00333F298A